MHETGNARGGLLYGGAHLLLLVGFLVGVVCGGGFLSAPLPGGPKHDPAAAYALVAAGVALLAAGVAAHAWVRWTGPLGGNMVAGFMTPLPFVVGLTSVAVGAYLRREEGTAARIVLVGVGVFLLGSAASAALSGEHRSGPFAWALALEFGAAALVLGFTPRRDAEADVLELVVARG